MAVDAEARVALPDYTIEREVGRGGMGIVFLGEHTRLGRRVAIKELPPSFAADPKVRERFSTEARTLAALAHPHIVPIYDYVERDRLCLIVMEELPGGTVWDRFTTVGLTAPVACATVLACCAALHHAHVHAVLHLDVKPDNLMFTGDGTVKVTDFGISRVISGDRTLGTADGQVLGTPAYMSPEQARGADLTARSDVYSAGIVLYELLSGELPWTGAETATELLLMRLRQPPRPLSEVAPRVPKRIADVVMRAIQVDPADRYASAEELGIAIATACSATWGPGWLERSGVPLVGADRVADAARTTSQVAAVEATSHDTSFGTARVAPTTTGEVVGAAAPAAPTVSSAPVARDGNGDGAAPVADYMDEFEVVRAASGDSRIGGLDLDAIEQAAFMDVASVMSATKSLLRPALVALGAALVAVVVALALFAAPSRGGTLSAGEVQLGSSDVAAPARVVVDTENTVAVRITSARLATVDHAVLHLSIAGVPLGDATASIAHGSGALDTNLVKYIGTGSVRGELDLKRGGAVVASEHFPMRVQRPWYLTALGVGALLLVFAGVAYVESLGRALRRSAPGPVAFIMGSVSVGAIALGAVAFVAALGHADPTISGVAVVAVGAVVVGAALVVTLRRTLLRRTIHRAVRRAGERSRVAA